MKLLAINFAVPNRRHSADEGKMATRGRNIEAEVEAIEHGAGAKVRPPAADGALHRRLAVGLAAGVGRGVPGLGLAGEVVCEDDQDAHGDPPSDVSCFLQAAAVGGKARS